MGCDASAACRRGRSGQIAVLRRVARDGGHERCKESCELLFSAAADFEDLAVVDGIGRDAGSGVCDEREAENLQAHVPGDDDLVDGGHADERGAEGAEGADLGGGFERWAEDGEVDALRQVDLLPVGFPAGESAQRR